MIQSDAVRSYFLWNPMHSFINLYREIILLGEITVSNLQISIVFAAVSYLLGGWLFMKIRPAFGDVL
jgi:lipopolysaccharide transport system permease protein